MHMCRFAYLNRCWWPLFFALKKRLTSSELELLTNYRYNFIEISMHNNMFGGGGHRMAMDRNENLRKKFMEFYDMRLEWTEWSPKKFGKNVRPRLVVG